MKASSILSQLMPIQVSQAPLLIKLVGVYLGLSLLAACGGTGQDNGSVANIDQTFAGVGVDGHLARATVFIDSNNNGTRDAWEAFAFTDDEGYYSYNPNSDTDYCGDEASSAEAQYCLRAITTLENTVVRIDGGYDVLTGEPFEGQLTRRVDTSGGENLENIVISPITSLFTDISEDDRNSVLELLGLEESDLDVDYMNADGNGGVDSSLFNTALKVHKAVTVLSDYLTDTYEEIGDEFGTPNDATSAVYPLLAERLLLEEVSSLDDVLDNEGILAEVLDEAETSLREVYVERGFDLPADLNTDTTLEDFERVIEVVSGLSDVVDTLIPPSEDLISIDEATGAARTVETVTIKSLEEDGSEDASLDSAIDFIVEPENEELVETLVVGLSGDNADITNLVNNSFTEFDTEEAILDAAVLPEDVEPFSVIGGLSLKVSDLDLGAAPNDLNDSEVIFFFEGASTAFEGAYSACVKYIEGANENGELGDANTRGELISGYWSLLGASDGDLASYSLLLTVEFLGATYQAIVKPYGTALIDDIEYSVVRSDNDGDFRNWYSYDGLQVYNSLPVTNEDCEAALPSRIGI